MSKLAIVVALFISILFLLMEGYKAFLAFWLVIGITLVVAFAIVGLDKILSRRKSVN